MKDRVGARGFTVPNVTDCTNRPKLINLKSPEVQHEESKERIMQINLTLRRRQHKWVSVQWHTVNKESLSVQLHSPILGSQTTHGYKEACCNSNSFLQTEFFRHSPELLYLGFFEALADNSQKILYVRACYVIQIWSESFYLDELNVPYTEGQSILGEEPNCSLNSIDLSGGIYLKTRELINRDSSQSSFTFDSEFDRDPAWNIPIIFDRFKMIQVKGVKS
ncbi:uncharacterized protein C8R40DRAFT_1072616 [Lentinula edodes]|uniref:uncharacterized protein n=1 Tax=Lentinula edodes TaxID=5353 RepID=UPI001E8E888C|nr:uncharacterized protein C8R40DRAFT_1072616 [Lentinula edodes]KAH7871319.1 hypothetical protein C8R40DRAFT_1072616 [Lentinula edodes]